MSELRERKKTNGIVFVNEGNMSSFLLLLVAGLNPGFAGKMQTCVYTCMCTVNAE